MYESYDYDQEHPATILTREGELIVPQVVALETLEQVDFAVLKQIFAEVRSRSGVTTKSNFNQRDAIVIVEPYDSLSHGSYSFIDGKVRINPVLIAEERSIESRGDLARNILSVLVHEEAHASGNNTHLGSNLVQRFRKLKSHVTRRPVELAQSGFSRVGYEKGDLSQRAKYFNEGITDMIAEGVYATYLERTGDRSLYVNQAGQVPFEESYLGSRVFLNIFMERIAQSVGIPFDKVWEGVMQGYMAGLDLGATELAKEFDMVFYPNCIEEIERAEDRETDLPYEALLESLDFEKVDRVGIARMRDSYKKFLDELAKQMNINQEVQGFESMQL